MHGMDRGKESESKNKNVKQMEENKVKPASNFDLQEIKDEYQILGNTIKEKIGQKLDSTFGSSA